MDVGDKESVRIQIGVDRDMSGAVRQGSEVAKAGTSGLYNAEAERILLLKLLTVSNGQRRYVLRKMTKHRGIKTEKPYENRAFSELPISNLITW